MDTRVINLSSDRYPVVEDVVNLSITENRSLANMAETLLMEAIKNREAKRSQVPADDNILK